MMLSTKHRRGVRGFSLIELMIVVAITLIVAAVAVPNVLNGMRMLRLRSSATSIAGLIQQTRQRSVRDNRNYAMLSSFVRINGVLDPTRPIAYIDLNNSGDYNPGEPMVTLNDRIVLDNGAPSSNPLKDLVTPPPSQMDFLLTSGFQTNPPTFNPRGWPCFPAGVGGGGPFGIQTCPTNRPGGPNFPVGYVYFLRSTVLPLGGWAAVTVSPGGRIKTWACNSGAVNQCNWR